LITGLAILTTRLNKLVAAIVAPTDTTDAAPAVLTAVTNISFGGTGTSKPPGNSTVLIVSCVGICGKGGRSGAETSGIGGGASFLGLSSGFFSSGAGFGFKAGTSSL
jgi:hypothetical protein